MEIKKKKLMFMLFGAFFAGIIVMGGICATLFNSPGSTLSGDDKLKEIKGYIDKYYLNDYDDQALVDGAYEGYVNGLGDPYSAYMSKETYESWLTSATGNYSGVGITFSENEKGYFEVISVNPDSPAEKAGVTAEQLKISEIFADESTTLKRGKPRAQGRIYKRLKRSSHLTVKVSDNK